MHLYIKKIVSSNANSLAITHEVLDRFFNGPSEALGGRSNFVVPMFHLSDAADVKHIEIVCQNGYSISDGLIGLLRLHQENIDANDLLYIERIGVSYGVKIIKQDNPNYKVFSALLSGNDRHLLLCLDDEFGNDQDDAEDHQQDGRDVDRQIKTCQQIIYYGVPGCGKSHTVDKEICAQIDEYNTGKVCDLKITYEKQVTRVVFHPDYCNADFIGQILPKARADRSGVDYVFKPGPFSQILRMAYLNPTKPYFLVIEEINRGNAAAIFGDLFQLLDRYKPGEHSGAEIIQSENYDYADGWSKYSITNDDINEFIRLGAEAEVVDKEEGVVYDSDNDLQPYAAIVIPSRRLHFSVNSGIRLPPNLSIYATMNTSDQNVFTLDNAFQRRWNMKQIPNRLNRLDPRGEAQYNLLIGDTGVKWGVFREEINKRILDPDYTSEFSSLEDKRLGGWFVISEHDGANIVSKECFADKVIKFLWDDAFKFNRSIFGNYEKKSLEHVTEDFVGEIGFGVFDISFRKALAITDSDEDDERPK